MTPKQLGWFDRGLGALAGTKLSESEKAAAVLLLNGYLFWVVRLTTELDSPAATEAPQPSSAFVQSLLDPDEFPALNRALAAGIFDDQDETDDRTWGLERILDGIEVLVEKRGRG